MKRALGILLLGPLVATGQTNPAQPAENQWRASGSTTLRWESYRTTGSNAGSPYVEESTQQYANLDLTLDGHTGPGKHWQFQLSGVLNDSEYRSAYNGFVPEKLYLLHENGNGDWPYRLELGDQRFDLTPLTLRKSLKGARMEFQPVSEVDGRRYSLVLASGADQASWKEFDYGADYYHAASFLAEDSSWGKLSLNLVYNGRAADEDSGRPAMSQWVGSIAYAKSLTLGSQALNLQGEWARFSGDVAEHWWQDEPSRTGTGMFVQLNGQDQNRPLQYNLRYQRYGADFQPNGGSVANDLQSVDGSASWTFDNGWRLDGRFGWEQYGFQGDNPTEVRNLGASLSGPVHLGRERPIQVNASVDQSTRQDEAGLTDTVSRRARVDVAVPVGDNGETRVGVGVSDTQDRNTPERDTRGYQLDLSHRQSVKMGDLDLSVTPGVSYSRNDGPAAQESVQPSLAIQAAKGRHQLSAQLSAQYQRDLVGDADVDTYRAGLRYEYRKGQHAVGAELEHQRREPELGESTDSTTAGVYYRYSFDKVLGG